MANQESLIIRDSGGTEADVTASNALKVDGSAVTQPVSAASLPLPTGAAIAANQQTDALTDAELRATPVPISGSLTPSGTQDVDITANTIGISTAAKQDLLLAELQLKADLTETQPVSVATLPLPSGAATSALQQNDALTDTELRATPVPVSGTVAVTGSATAANQVTEIAALGTLDTSVNLLLTDAELRATPVPVSGTVAITSATLATEATLADVRTSVQLIDNAISGSEMQVDVVTMPAITGTVTANAGTNLNTSALALETTQSSINTKTPSLGQAAMASSVPVVIASNQSAVPVSFAAASVLFRGRTATFRTLGMAGTVGQKILAIHNATGSTITVKVNKIVVDMWCTVVKAVTVAPPIVRIWKFTVLPTNGTVLTKNKVGGTTTSSASVTVRGDASADGTGSATTLTVTLPAGTMIDQLVCPRVITAVGEIVTNPMKFEYSAGIQLAALEGFCVFLDYTLATQNPITDMWVASIEWEETTT